ncbi:1-(5-phosphoribosyl)-5-[(5-phosphoribosylamino)methylideneamino]imidazole-4-carboxamide isomerase [Chitinophaga ginsengisoli]|uniref:1-(5-phosphoribosyl)-5-[(5-phosphoribosylamino)methylideneamino] imidazole-4-carboxamide isomerase n=1 Tax=Chitinophaga ginsengisoli TaxID=363837 RepID=A0A2P8G753_9BACT|nr:1-(5-phosphoribosyl)-5-[(5-phosphoribosylamino)methylideneamino]imidazole-4-carboxamide isomerase [Chitinophaga ginsengisoli]PSL29809.1 1-(5-phosphoribosyl)-5-[(5-phosphoribosylamino)methylideneamino] imidazole-4-carboxamide isomerase [Chitinophaga ginsengisoli]
MQPIQIRRINPEDTLQLRRDVLYPDATLEAVRVDHDDDGLHFGLFEDTRLRGIVSLFPQKDVAQFRKLAVHPDCQGKGYGSLLMQHIEDFCRKEHIPTLWCNARNTAEGFYVKRGYAFWGDHFTKDNIVFCKMKLQLDKATGSGFAIIPAIDIIDGKCVRLTQGDYGQKKVYNEHPLEVAKVFESIGVRRLHLVDLDGAKKGSVVNWKVLEAIAGKTGLVIDFGGGIKTEDDLRVVYENGAALATIGSIAVKDPALFAVWVKKYGAEKIFLGADVKEEKIAVGGWLETTELSVFDFLEENVKQGLKHIFCTDIAKDGLLQGPSITLYEKILQRFPQIDFVASGGVSTMADVHALAAAGCSGVIVGKAIYEERISMAELSEFLKSNP